MRTSIDEPIAVRRPTAKEASLDLRLRGHGRTDADLDPAALALAHPAEDRHDQVVSLGLRVDGTTDLGHPQLNAIVREDRESQAVLVPVERPLRLADNDSVEPATSVPELHQQGVRLRAALPRNRTRLANVEELGDDLAVPISQRLCARTLPVPRRLGVLLVLRRHPPVEREPWQHARLLSFSVPLRPRRSTRLTGDATRCAAAEAAHGATAGVRTGGSSGTTTRSRRACSWPRRALP